MKIAIFSDVHDNLVRWREAAGIIKAEGIRIGICCGDIGEIETLKTVAKSFEKLYLCFGNFDYKLKNYIDSRWSLSAGEIPASAGMTKEGGAGKNGLENVEWFEKTGEFEIAGKKIVINHYDYNAKRLAKSGKYDIVFYGHTHTPWEEMVGKTRLLNPGEIAGQFGKASFAIYDLQKMKAELKILK